MVSPDPPPAVVAALRAAGCVFAEDEARLLLEAAGRPPSWTRHGRAGGSRDAAGARARLGGVLRAADRGRARASSCPGGGPSSWSAGPPRCPAAARSWSTCAAAPARSAPPSPPRPRRRAARRRRRSRRGRVRAPQPAAAGAHVYAGRPLRGRCPAGCAAGSTCWSPTRRTCRPTRSPRCRPRPATTSRGSRSTAARTGSTCPRVAAGAPAGSRPAAPADRDQRAAGRPGQAALMTAAGLAADVPVRDDDVDGTVVTGTRPA